MKLQSPSIYVCIVMIITLACCQTKDKPGEPGNPDEHAYVHPPIQGIDVPSRSYSFVAEQGDTIFHTSRSILVFPANSVVDKDSKPITGKVDIIYRELSDQVDFFLAGIPMDYQENGNLHSNIPPETKTYTSRMQMFEINAKKHLGEQYKEIKTLMDLNE